MNKNYIIIENKNLVARVFFRNIIYIEQYRRETSVITQKRIFKYNAVLKDLYEEVDSRFYMCHRSYIINFDYVRPYGKPVDIYVKRNTDYNLQSQLSENKEGVCSIS